LKLLTKLVIRSINSKLLRNAIGIVVVAVSNLPRMVEDLSSTFSIGLNNMSSIIMNFPFSNSSSLDFSNKRKWLLAATAAVLVRCRFFEERERLRNARGAHAALAAFDFRNAIRIFANKFAFGFRALRLVAFPVAFGFFADRLAFRFGRLAVSDAVRLFAYCDALRTVEHFAAFIGTLDFALWFFAFYITDRVFRFGAGCMAFGWFADWIAYGWAVRIIAFP